MTDRQQTAALPAEQTPLRQAASASASVTPLAFNVLTTPWVPLDVGNATELVSYAALLTGERDGADLRHPRDDLRFFAKTLLSALTQALFAPKDRRELTERLAKPLQADDVAAALEPVRDDFRLVGPGAFLQSSFGEAKKIDVETGRLFLDLLGTSSLFCDKDGLQAICPACAVPALYGLQGFIGAGGAGLKAGVRGNTPVTTLVRTGSVRSSMWANVLCQQEQATIVFAKDPPRPWRQEAIEKPWGAIGLVEGLFWQPRAVRLEEAPAGRCGACGATGGRVQVRGFAKKSGTIKEGWFSHPYSPTRRTKRGTQYQNLRSDRPSWTGLADMLSTMSGANAADAKAEAAAAPAVRQWAESVGGKVTLDVFQIVFNKASIVAHVNETFSLSLRVDDRDLLGDVRDLVSRAEQAAQALGVALKRAHSSHKKDRGGFWVTDALATLWRRSEAPFWAALEALQAGGADVDAAIAQFSAAVAAIARSLFDEHTEASATDGRKQHLVARARMGLILSLAKAGLATKGSS